MNTGLIGVRVVGTAVKMKNSVSIIVPAYKEEKFIEKTIMDFLQAFRSENLDFEIITVIDKVPNDKTFDIVKKISQSEKEIVVISKDGKQGIGNAIRTGIKEARKHVIIIATAEVSEDPSDLVKMCLKMNQGYDMVFGNRFSSIAKREGYEMKKYIANRLCNYAIKILFQINSNDVTNAIKVYKSSILKNLKTTSRGFGIFAEIPLAVYINGHKNFAEIPIKHYARSNTHSKFNLLQEGNDYFNVVMKYFFKKLFKN